jgi:hypothetical protein
VGVGGSCALACSSNIAMRPCDLRPACGRQRECVSAPHRKHEESSGSERGLPQSRLAAGVGVAVRLTTWLVRTIPFNTARHWLQKPCGARQTQSLFCLQKQKIPVSVKTREATGDPVCLVCLGGRSVLPAAMLQLCTLPSASPLLSPQILSVLGTYLQPPVYGARQTSSRFSISERNNTLWENSH